jgi:tetratricopeptide (TPR) repeat protein
MAIRFIIAALLALVVTSSIPGQAIVTVAPTQNRWEELYASGITAYEHADYAGAEKALNASLEVSGASTGQLMTSLRALEAIFNEQGDYVSEERILLKQLYLLGTMKESTAVQKGQVFQKLGTLSSFVRKYSEAARYYKQALALFKDDTQAFTLERFILLNNLGWAEFRSNRFQSAETHFRESLYIVQKSVGDKSVFYGLTANNLAELYRHTGKTRAAITWYRKAMAALAASVGRSDSIFTETAARYESLRKELPNGTKKSIRTSARK